MALRHGWAAAATLLLACSAGGGGDGGASDRCAGVTCTAEDTCHVAGACDPATGACSNPVAPEGTLCPGGTCRAGGCVPSGDLCAGVVCEAVDPCHPAGACDPASGACVSEPAADGTACPGDGVCAGGACVAADGSSCTDGVRNGGETAADCGGPHCPACSDGRACAAPADCASGACAAGSCVRPVAALVADAGPRATVAAGAHVRLDGTRSRSPLGAITSWAWTQTSGPAVALAGADGPRPELDAPAGGDVRLAFALAVGDGAGTASAEVEVLVRAPAHPPEDTSLGLVLDALHEGRLDRDTAMTYLAFGVYGDPRLPEVYRGAAEAPSGSSAMAIVAESFPHLAPATQDLLRPFLLPPSNPASHVPATAASGAGTARAAAAPPPPAYAAVSSARAVVWYRQGWAAGRATATALSRELEAVIWPSLQAVFGAPHMPVRDDTSYPLPKGAVRGKLNVYLRPSLPGAYGVAHSWVKTPAPTWIEVREALPFHGKNPPGMAQVLAHETTHACQNSYAHHEPAEGHRWIYEGTATWAEDHVYPGQNSEHMRAAQLLEYAYLPIDDEWSNRPYSTYLLFQQLTRGNFDDDYVERVFSRFQDEPALQAADGALPSAEGHPTGFEVWLRPFAAAAWNQDPDRPFWANDGLTVKAKPMVPATPLSMATPILQFPGLSVPQLGLFHYELELSDPAVRQVYLYDGLSFALAWRDTDEGRYLTVQDGWHPDDKLLHTITSVLALRDDAWTPLALPPALGGMIACQDDPEQRADELAITFGNAYPFTYRIHPPGPVDPTLVLSDVSCGRWEGTVTGQTSPGEGPPVEETTATVSWVRDPAYAAAGQAFYTPALVRATWRISGSVGSCTYEGSDAWTDAGLMAGALTFAPHIVSGPWHRAYDATGGGHVVTYRVICEDGQGGTSVTTVTKPVFWIDTRKQGDPLWRPKVAAGGRRASDTVDDGSMVWTWDFTSPATP